MDTTSSYRRNLCFANRSTSAAMLLALGLSLPTAPPASAASIGARRASASAWRPWYQSARRSWASGRSGARFKLEWRS